MEPIRAGAAERICLHGLGLGGLRRVDFPIWGAGLPGGYYPIEMELLRHLKGHS